MKALLMTLALFCQPVLACTEVALEQALQLVEQNNPQLQAAKALYRSQLKQSDWKARLHLAYANAATESSDSHASVQLEIPLFDAMHEIRQQQNRQAMKQQHDELMSQFLLAAKQLCTDLKTIAVLQQTVQFDKDRLQYQQHRVDEGLAEAVSLWAFARALQKTEQALAQQQAEIAMTIYQVARKYGGRQWKPLQTLLVAEKNSVTL